MALHIIEVFVVVVVKFTNKIIFYFHIPFEDLEEYLERGGNPNAVNRGGTTILKQASKSNQNTIVELLLEYGAETYLGDTRNRVLRHHGNVPPLFVSFDNLDTTRLLLEGKADVNYNTKIGTPLHVAAKNGLNDVVELLLEYGADPNIEANVIDPLWIQLRDRDPVTGQIIPVINAPRINLKPEELAILSGHPDIDVIINDHKNTQLAKLRLALMTGIDPRALPGQPFSDYDMVRTLADSFNYDQRIQRKMEQEEQRDKYTKARQRLATMRGTKDSGSVLEHLGEPKLLEDISSYLSSMRPVHSIQERMRLKDLSDLSDLSDFEPEPEPEQMGRGRRSSLSKRRNLTRRRFRSKFLY